MHTPYVLGKQARQNVQSIYSITADIREIIVSCLSALTKSSPEPALTLALSTVTFFSQHSSLRSGLGYWLRL